MSSRIVLQVDSTSVLARSNAKSGTRSIASSVILKLFAEPQYECLPLAIGEFGDVCPEALFPLLCFQSGRGCGTASAGRIAVLAEYLQPVVPPVALPAALAFDIQKDSVEPGVDLAVTAELRLFGGNHEKGFLGQIVRIPRVATEYERSPVNARKVLAVKVLGIKLGQGGLRHGSIEAA